jgi:hypothetical protein
MAVLAIGAALLKRTHPSKESGYSGVASPSRLEKEPVDRTPVAASNEIRSVAGLAFQKKLPLVGHLVAHSEL